VLITHKAKASYKDGYMIVKSDESENIIHLSEIATVIFENTAINITAYLLCELANNKVKIIFCDHKRNPYGEVIPYYGRYNVSKKMMIQTKWGVELKKFLWLMIVKQKIKNQSMILRKFGYEMEAVMLESYANEVQLEDVTNREGHAAKVYFNALFGKKFSRDQDNPINAALNYGYSILLSTFNREISNNGYSTSLGINHISEYNPFNLSSDLIEPFRVIVDDYVYRNRELAFSQGMKLDLIDLLNTRTQFDEQNQFITKAIELYVRSFFQALEEKDVRKFKLYEYKD
jgi:CRISPR-associated endonuclease cas1, NMENI subtype